MEHLSSMTQYVIHPGRGKQKEDGGFYGHMTVNKIKVGSKKVKAKKQVGF